MTVAAAPAPTPATAGSVIWAESDSRISAKQFGQTKHLVGHYQFGLSIQLQKSGWPNNAAARG